MNINFSIFHCRLIFHFFPEELFIHAVVYSHKLSSSGIDFTKENKNINKQQQNVNIIKIKYIILFKIRAAKLSHSLYVNIANIKVRKSFNRIIKIIY